MDKKAAHIFQKVAQNVAKAVSDFSQNSPKIREIFGLLLKENLMPRTIKKSPNRVTMVKQEHFCNRRFCFKLKKGFITLNKVALNKTSHYGSGILENQASLSFQAIH